jgi:hypothetical protein
VALLLRDIQSGRLSARATQQQQQQQLGGATLGDSRPDNGADATNQAASRGAADSHEDSRHSAASQLAELRLVVPVTKHQLASSEPFDAADQSLAPYRHRSLCLILSANPAGPGSA